MISTCPESTATGSLLVFSDDWGRHPSSCQHLVRNLLDRYPVLWVNTIGTCAPRLDRQTINRVAEKLRQWGSAKLLRTGRGETARGELAGGSAALPPQPPAAVLRPEPPTGNTLADRNLTVVNPKMWPWFGSPRDRRFNRWLLSSQLTPLIQKLPQPVVGLTTLPITADLPEVLPVSRWVYYCVDDFSQWPGLDGDTLRRMDRDMIRRADSLVAVSETLQAMIAAEGRSASLLTHGVDVDFWKTSQSVLLPEEQNVEHPGALQDFPQPRVVFWGVIDRRLDSSSLRQLSQEMAVGTIVLIGPQQNPDPAILSLRNVRTLPAQPLAALPGIAANADVLIMPYADLPVTRAMQPLKLKEYLATGKSVVVNQLPSTDSWSDCLDVAATPEEFSRLVRERIVTGIPESQRTARVRLQQESWSSKAEQLLTSLKAQPQAPSFTAQPQAPALAPALSAASQAGASGWAVNEGA